MKPLAQVTFLGPFHPRKLPRTYTHHETCSKPPVYIARPPLTRRLREGSLTVITRTLAPTPSGWRPNNVREQPTRDRVQLHNGLNKINIGWHKYGAALRAFLVFSRTLRKIGDRGASLHSAGFDRAIFEQNQLLEVFTDRKGGNAPLDRTFRHSGYPVNRPCELRLQNCLYQISMDGIV